MQHMILVHWDIKCFYIPHHDETTSSSDNLSSQYFLCTQKTHLFVFCEDTAYWVYCIRVFCMQFKSSTMMSASVDVEKSWKLIIGVSKFNYSLTFHSRSRRSFWMCLPKHHQKKSEVRAFVLDSGIICIDEICRKMTRCLLAPWPKSHETETILLLRGGQSTTAFSFGVCVMCPGPNFLSSLRVWSDLFFKKSFFKCKS